MNVTPRFRHLATSALLIALTAPVLIAQHDDHDDNHGHGGTPPGHAKKYDHDDHDRGRDDRGLPPGQAKHVDEGRALPPGQAKKYFRDEDRDRYYSHYRADVDRWRGRPRPVFVVGQPIARTYVVQPVPQSMWAAPPPPGYIYGYYGGYMVAYNPSSRIIGDVLDLSVSVHIP